MNTPLFPGKTEIFPRYARSILVGSLILSFLISPLGAYAAGGGGGGGGGVGVTCTFTGDISSDWVVAGNWSCGHAPTGGDTVVIPNAKSVELSAVGAVGMSLQIDSGGSLAISGGTLTTSGGTFANSGLLTLTGGTTTISSYMTTNSGSMVLNGGILTFGTNTLTNNGTIAGSGTGTILEAGSIFNSPSGIINHTGGWQIRVGSNGFANSGTYNSTADDSIFRFTGSGSVVPTTVTYPNLEFAGTISALNNSRFIALGNISLLSGLNFTANSSTFILSGNWTSEATTAILNNNTTVEFTGSATSTLTADPNGAIFYDIKVNKDTVNKGVQLLSSATATHALVLTQGLFDYNGHTLTLPESCTFVGGTTAWEISSNWDCAGVPRLPNSTDTVTIPSGQSPIMVATESTIGSLAIEALASLEVRAGSTLFVYGTSTNAGTITINAVGGAIAGVVRLEGGIYSTSTNSGLIQALDGGMLTAYVPLVNLGTIDVSASGKLTLDENMDTVGDLNVSGFGELILEGSGYTTFPPTRWVPMVSPIGTLRIALNDSNGRISLPGNATTTVGLTINVGRLDLNNNVLNLDGTANLEVGSMGDFFGGGVMAFTGSGDQTIIAFSISPPSVQVRKTSGQVSQGTAFISAGNAFEVVSGTYVINGGIFFSNSSFTIDAAGTVSSTVLSTLTLNSGFTNAGTMFIDGTATVAGTTVNNGTVHLGPAISMTAGALTNNGSIVGDASGGTLTLNSSFSKGGDSVFNAPLTVLFSGPTDMPAYSYNNVTINNDVTLSANADVLTFGQVTLSPGAPGPVWTIQNTGTAQSDVGATISSLNIQSGASVVFSGVSVGPTVTTTRALTNDGSLTLNNASLSLEGLAVDGLGDPTTSLTGSGEYVFTNSDLRIFGSVPETIPAAVYHNLALLGSGTYALSASTTVMATTTIASTATLNLSTYRLNSIGDIANTGLITSSTGAVLHHPMDYILFSDSSGNLANSLADDGSLYITIKDQSRNLNGAVIETILASATSTASAGSDSEAFTLFETSASSGIFRNTSAIAVNGATAATTANGTFEITGNGEGRTTYSDVFDTPDTSSTFVVITYSQPAVEDRSTSINMGGGAVGSSGGVLSYVSSFSPLMPLTPVMPARSVALSLQTVNIVKSDAEAFNITLSGEEISRIAAFIENGTSKETQALGVGERRALLRDVYDTLGKVPTNVDLERLAMGEIAKARNLTKEAAQLFRVRNTFRSIYGHDPNFKNTQENLAWNTLMYRIRFPRDMKKEAVGGRRFRTLFKKTPIEPFQWAAVRVLGYVR